MIFLNTFRFTNKGLDDKKEAQKAKEFVNSRIHVERAINRIKKYQIFKGTLPITMMQYGDEIVFVCAELCNMKNVLI